MIGFLIGLVIGGLLGFLVAALMAAASRGDELERLQWLERRERARRDREYDERRLREPNGDERGQR